MKSFVYLVILFLFTSCIGTKKLSYMLDDGKTIKDDNGFIITNMEEYRLQPDDAISIVIKAIDPDINKLLGTFTANNSDGGNISFVSQIIDKNGYVDVLGLGSFQLAGKTLHEAKIEIQRKLNEKFYQPSVSVVDIRLDGINFNIIGEVNNPGPKVVKRSKIDILEAISLSGDLTRVANRKKVIIIRQYPEGKRQVYLDVTKASIINSPYFFIHPNDIIIINPRFEKITGIGTTSILNDFIHISTLTLTVITMYLFFKSL